MGTCKEGKLKCLKSDFATKTFKCGAHHDRISLNRKKLLMEAGSLVELQHLHDVRLADFGRFEKQLIFVMEFMTTDLRRSMTIKPQSLTDSEKLDIITDIEVSMGFSISQQ